MKNPASSLLLAFTLLFIGFILGFLTGRNSGSDAIFVSVPDEMMTLPVITEATEREICFPINLNTADMDELMALPEIGEKLAFRIISYRREKGRFHELTDLLKVEGVTNRILEEIQDLVYIGG